MTEKDITLKHVISDQEKFADLINVAVYEGQDVIQPEQVERLAGESSIIFEDKNGKQSAIKRHRDVIERVARGTHFVIFACENQSHIHYAMPVRNMVYDALAYEMQVRTTGKNHKIRKDKLREGFLSGFRKEDKLYPVVTIVLYFGRKDWDGATDLYSMLDIDEKELKVLKKYMPNYHVNLIHVRKIENLEKYKSGLKELFGILRYESDADALAGFLRENQERCSHLEEDVYMALTALLGEQKRLKLLKSKIKNEEGYDMCKAFDQMEQRGIIIGEQRGEKRGEQKGENKGIEKVNILNERLVQENRIDDMIRSVKDTTYQKKLFEYYQI